MDTFNLWINDPRCNQPINDEYVVAIQKACSLGRLEMVRDFLADPRFPNYELMFYQHTNDNYFMNHRIYDFIAQASENGHTEIVRLLLADARGFDPSVFNNRAVKLSILNNHHDTTKLLLSDPRVSIPDQDP
jgi:hypothetical protein